MLVLSGYRLVRFVYVSNSFLGQEFGNGTKKMQCLLTHNVI